MELNGHPQRFQETLRDDYPQCGDFT